MEPQEGSVLWSKGGCWGVNLEVGWVWLVWIWRVGWVWHISWVWLVNIDHPAGTPGTLVLFPVGCDRTYFGVERLLAGATEVDIKELEAKDVGGFGWSSFVLGIGHALRGKIWSGG